jgi:long-chain fatty acid transport protein
MQTVSIKKKHVASAVAAVVLALGAGQAFGAAFALQEQNGSGLGNAYAGGAAVAEDASTVWANPAGMARFSTIQIVAAVNAITPSAKFKDGGSLPAFNQPLGNTGGDAGDTAAVPAMYVVVPINKSFAFGLGISVPFGLKTEWDNGWLGRYQGVRSKVETINVNPALSWRVNDQFSVGVGVDYQQIKATFTSAANYSGALATAAQSAAAAGLIPAAAVAPFVGATPGLDSGVSITGDDWAWGWNLGVMWNITPDMRIGAHYRSSIKYSVTGNVNFSNPSLPALPPTLAPIGAALAPAVNGVLASGGVKADIELPSFTNVSIFAKLNPKWDIMADIQFTNWSTIENLTFVRTSGALLQSTPENFKDVWRVSVGANYYLDDKWKLRGGLAYDQSPVRDAQRTPRLPDSDRYWVATGAQYAYSPQLKLDIGLAYLWIDNASSNQNAGNQAQSGLIKGNYEANVWIVGGQASYSF